jgi:N-acetylneuraminic acid mutarotase
MANRLVTFAGFTEEGRFDDTWAFAPTTATWTNLGLVANHGRRCVHTASYDPGEHRMIIYGGQRSGELGDLWALDLDTHVWTEFTPAASRQGRTFPASVYDAHGQRFIIFGGGAGGGVKFGDTWAFDFATGRWERLGSTGPIARNGAVGVYLAHESRALFFGGVGTEVRFNDVWALEGLAPAPPPTAVEAASWGTVKAERKNTPRNIPAND